MIRAAVLALVASCAPAVVWTGRTPDRRHALTVKRDGDLDFVLVDGQRRAAYRGIAGWSIAVANEHVAFAARVNRRWVVVRDGHVERERWDGIGELRLSDAGLVYSAARAGGWHVVVNGVVGPRHDAILANTLRTEGAHVAYVAQQAARSRVVVDGKLHEPFDGIGQLVLRRDGRSSYIGRRGLDMHAVIDGAIGPARAQVSQIELSRDRFAYATTVEDDARLVIDGALGPAVDSIRLVQWSDDGAHVAWLGRIGTLDILSVDDKPVAAWPARRDPKLAMCASTLAYVATVPNGERMMAGDVAGPIFDEVRAPVCGPNGVVYAALRAGTWIVVDNGRERDAGTAVGDPVVANQRIAFGGRRGTRAYVTVDDRTFTYDLVFTDTVAFSRDGKRWGAIVGDLAKEQLYIVVDGTRKIPVDVKELYSGVASGNDRALIEWTRAELER